MRHLEISRLFAAVVLLSMPSLASVASACTCGGQSPCESHAGAFTLIRLPYREGNCVSTDAAGRFKIKAIEGQTYHLVGSVVGPGGGLISTKPVVVRVEKENSPVKLVVERPV